MIWLGVALGLMLLWLVVEFFRAPFVETDPNKVDPNIIIVTCNQCGRRHWFQKEELEDSAGRWRCENCAHQNYE